LTRNIIYCSFLNVLLSFLKFIIKTV